ncbi:MAG: carboxynorspermidine decarboxylase [Myxococcales bacterium]|nr:carboxynorspermidine decarboxylase [Myxococcales bacterium]
MEGTGLLSPGLLALDPSRIQTPAFIIDKGALRANLAVLGEVQELSGASILLALKAFAPPSLAADIREVLPGIAASGPHEARMGRDEFAGIVHTYSPAYSPRHFSDVARDSDYVIFNSIAEYERHAPTVREAGRTIACGLRINPEHSEVTTSIYDPCAPGSRLGITREQLGSPLPDGITGLHFHTLCELGADALQRTLAAVEQRFGDLLPGLTWMNWGGGHHITKPDYDTELLVRLVKDWRRRHDIEVFLEPGEAIAIRTGILVTSVLDITKSGEDRNVILDISATAHMPDVLEMPYRPDIIGADIPDAKAHTYRLGGMSCLAGDVIGDYSFDTPLAIGQRLTFPDMSHYTMVKTTNFNGVHLPSIALYEPETDSLDCVREFGYETYRDRL